MSNTEATARRFGGIERLYGQRALANFETAHIGVIGLGGVGSWVAEALARSAIGTLTLYDMDVVAESNINRQLLASDASLGRDKVAVMQARIEDINPDCRVNAVDDFVTRDNLQSHLSADLDFVVDCIDDFRTKAAIIAYCKRQKLPIITVGGAGGQLDPARIRKLDLARTEHDVLLARTRKLLRQEYGFARNPKRNFSIPAVFSDEQLRYADGAGGVTMQRPSQGGLTGLSCASGLGSVTHVTASFGMIAAAHVLWALSR